VAVFKEDIADGTTFTSCGVRLSLWTSPDPAGLVFGSPRAGCEFGHPIDREVSQFGKDRG